MNARLQKEIRPLIFPGALIALCAGLRSAEPFINSHKESGPLFQLGSFIIGVTGFGFFGGIALLAAMSFGTEFQQRTLVLLLSQPRERLRTWCEKMFVLAGVAAVVSILQCFALYLVVGHEGFFNEPHRIAHIPPALFLVLFVFVVVSSTMFWTLVARSTIGGMTFSLTAICMGALFVRTMVTEFYGPASEQILFPIASAVVGLGYSAICLWLGWRKFAGMEMRDAFAGEIISVPTIFPGARWLGDLLRPRPGSAILNLVRKELRLQKPVFLLGTLLTICWIFVFALFLLLPERRSYFENTFDVLTCVSIFLVLLLGGCISQGEEKTLGVAAWHLTLPPSAFRQWFIKFAVAFGVCLLCALILPFVLAYLTSFQMKVGLMSMFEQRVKDWIPLLSFGSLFFVLSFWAGSLTGNTVRAALTTVFTYIAFVAPITLAEQLSEQGYGLQTSLFIKLTMHQGWSSQKVLRLDLQPFFFAIPSLIAAIALSQSFRSFRRVRTSEGFPLKQPLIIIVVTFLACFWVMDLNRSANHSWQFLNARLSSLVQSLTLKESDFLPSAGTWKKISLKEFENTSQPIPADMKSWLENATVTLYQNPQSGRPGSHELYPYRVVFKFGSANSIADQLVEKSVDAIPWIPPEKRNPQSQQKEKK